MHLLMATAAASGVTVEQLRLGGQRASLVRARRLAVVAGVMFLGRRVGEVAASLGISSQAASYLLRTGDPLLVQARAIAESVRAEWPLQMG